MQRRKWWGRLITGGRWELCELWLFALVCDILLFSSEGPNGRLAKKALRSVVGDVLSLQMFSCSFHTSKIITSASSVFSASSSTATLLPCKCYRKAGTNVDNIKRGRVVILRTQNESTRGSSVLPKVLQNYSAQLF